MDSESIADSMTLDQMSNSGIELPQAQTKFPINRLMTDTDNIHLKNPAGQEHLTRDHSGVNCGEDRNC